MPISILPEVKDSSDDFGYTTLFGGKINIGGIAGDQQAATIGQACFSPGSIKSTYGTGCFMIMNIGEKIKISKNNLLTTIAYRINNKTTYALEGSIFIAGAVIQWLRDEMKFFKSADESGIMAEEADQDQRLYFVPAFTGLGAPYWQPDVRGAIFGLNRNTGQKEITKAFVRGPNRQTSGFGLGLSISNKVVMAHGGSLKLCNNKETPGVTITLCFPKK